MALSPTVYGLATVTTTVTTSRPALVVAAAVMGTLFGAQRRAWGGIQAPVPTNLTWSVLMLRYLPPLFKDRELEGRRARTSPGRGPLDPLPGRLLLACGELRGVEQSESRHGIGRGMTAPAAVQPAHTLVWPTLQAVLSLGGSARLAEITDRVVDLLALPEEVQALPHAGGPQTELEYRLAWARTYLKNIDALENSARGVWAVTDTGRGLDEDDCSERMRRWRADVAASRATASRSVPAADYMPADDVGPTPLPDAADADAWREELLQLLLGLSPDAFERLASRLLREAGFININVTGRSGDEGIDGTGIYRLSLVSFPVFFQCKRYRGSVGPGEIRDFRGAMQGRGDRGLVLTTGTFTRSAKAEATRAGTQPIDLIDGQRLCDLMKDYAIGLTVTPRTVEDVRVDPGFFDEL